MKLQVRLDLYSGLMLGPFLDHGRVHDSSSCLQTTDVPIGALRVADLGYFRLDTFRELDQRGSYFLSRLKTRTKLFYQDGTELNLSEVLTDTSLSRVEMCVLVGRTHRLSSRLIALRVPSEVSVQRRRRLKDQARKRQQPLSKAGLALCDWTILMTNVPPDMLSVDEAMILARARWQIKLVFKLWKQHGLIDEWRSENPWRILCEVYAKLISVLITHWVMVLCCWRYPDRSLVKASQTVRSYAVMLASSMIGLIDTDVVLEQIGKVIESGYRMNTRRKHPNTYQLLLGLNSEA